jgi:LacI family transcriptional regulator
MSNSQKKRITIKDIAEITGFSISTVSKAFNESYEISEETKNKINEVAKSNGYRPNKAALSLRSGKNFVVAVVMPSVEDPFYARIFHGIQYVITNTNYSVITCITRESLEKEVNIIDKVYNQVDAFIIAVAEETLIKKEFSHLESIVTSHKPLVIIDRGIETLNCSNVLSSSHVAVRDITELAFKEGYRKVALVSCTKNVNNEWKVKGFLEASEKMFGEENEKLVLNSDLENVEKDLCNLVTKEAIDCIIAIDEEASFASLRVAKKLEKNIPKDLAIVGYMSEKVAEYLDIPFTTINQHRKKMGQEVMNLILQKLDPSSNDSIQKINIKSTLIRRKSF